MKEKRRTVTSSYVFVLIGSDGNELGLWKDEDVDIVERSHGQFRVADRWMSSLNHMKARNIFMHGIQDNLNGRIIVLCLSLFVRRYSHDRSDRWYYWSISIYWMIVVVSSTVLPWSYYPDEDRNDLALRINQSECSVRWSIVRLTVRFSCPRDHPLRIVIFVAMTVNRYHVHVDDVLAAGIETSERHFVGWKHASRKKIERLTHCCVEKAKSISCSTLIDVRQWWGSVTHRADVSNSGHVTHSIEKTPTGHERTHTSLKRFRQ